MAELPSIGKDSKFPEGWAYRGIEALTAKLQPLLAKHEVVIVPFAESWEVVPSPAAKDGWTDVRLTVTWKVYGPEGDCLTARTAGIGRDRSDKGMNKAQTQAFKYLLLGLFCVSDKADDADGQADDEATFGMTELRARLGKELAKLPKPTLDVIRTAMKVELGVDKLADVRDDQLMDVLAIALTNATPVINEQGASQ